MAKANLRQTDAVRLFFVLDYDNLHCERWDDHAEFVRSGRRLKGENSRNRKDCDRAGYGSDQGLATDWTTPYASQFPNKVALHRSDNDELLGLMSYELDEDGLAVEIIYLENAGHSNANLLHAEKKVKKYIGIARALFAYAVQISLNAGYDGVLIFKAKTSELLAYYTEAFGARQVASYDPFRLVIWEDAAADIIADYLEGGVDDGSEKI